MIWIIGEYAERIDNADELLESFLEGFQDENSQVSHVIGLWTVSGPLCVVCMCVCVCVCVCVLFVCMRGWVYVC